MKVVVVGGTGNISEEIVKLLVSEGHDVSCFNRGKRPAIPGSRLLIGDRGDIETFEAIMQQERFDAAIDMICFTAEQAHSSVRAFRGVGHFVQCSTVCTYGVDYDVVPVPETHPRRANTSYGRQKVEADEVYLAAHEKEGFPVTIVKPSTTYGPQLGPLRQLAWEFSWIDRLREGRPLLLSDQGQMRLQFLHVRDAAEGFVGILENNACIGQTYNLVNPGPIAWIDHHRLAREILGSSSELLGLPFPEIQKLRAPRFTICREIFGFDAVYDGRRLMQDVPRFQPKVSLRQGMEELIEGNYSPAKSSRLSNTWEDRLIAKHRDSLARL